jgi:hypothetical protein
MEAKEALKHALDALGDGSGHEVWGPGPVGAKLHEHSKLAGMVFDMAAIAAVQLQHTGRVRMTATIRKLAPVLLEVIDDDSRI